MFTKSFLIYSIVALVSMIFFFNKKPIESQQDSKKTTIQKLVRQAARWTTAAKQDNNAMIRVLHANYGAGFLWALQSIATDSEIANTTGINVKEFEKEIVAEQDTATRRAAGLCPGFAPSKSFLSAVAGESSSS